MRWSNPWVFLSMSYTQRQQFQVSSLPACILTSISSWTQTVSTINSYLTTLMSWQGLSSFFSQKSAFSYRFFPGFKIWKMIRKLKFDPNFHEKVTFWNGARLKMADTSCPWNPWIKDGINTLFTISLFIAKTISIVQTQ